MTRLTKHVRERMTNLLLNRRFEAQGKALGRQSIELFKLVYEDVYDLHTRRLMAQMRKRHPKAFEVKSSLEVSTIGGITVSVGCTRIGEGGVFFSPECPGLPVLNSARYNRFASYSTEELGLKVQEFAQATKAFADQIKAARNEVNGALANVTTDRQLSELWPEAMPVIGHLIPDASPVNLPAVQFAKLTSEFGLPGVEGAAK